MKSSLLCLVFCLCVALGVNRTEAQTTVTFDDISLLTYGGPIPSGYAGLDWYSFGVLAPESFPGDPMGYRNGMVSPGHVAFNGYANSDGSTSGGFGIPRSVFNLDSAYLTAAFNDDLQVRVTGFLGGALKYSQEYTVAIATPTLVNFNYLGIDRVEIHSFGGRPQWNPFGGGTSVAMDNLVITVPEPGTISLLVLAVCLSCFHAPWRRKPTG